MGEYNDWSLGEIIDRMISLSVTAAITTKVKPKEYYVLSTALDERLSQFNPQTSQEADAVSTAEAGEPEQPASEA